MTTPAKSQRGRITTLGEQVRRPALALAAVTVLLCTGGCGTASRQSAAQGSHHSARLQQPPAQAAACFARNAEEHSSALVAEVVPRGNSAEVIVRVKNGVLYGTGDFQRAGSGSAANITLMVTTTGRSADLLDALLEGC